MSDSDDDANNSEYDCRLSILTLPQKCMEYLQIFHKKERGLYRIMVKYPYCAISSIHYLLYVLKRLRAVHLSVLIVCQFLCFLTLVLKLFFFLPKMLVFCLSFFNLFVRLFVHLFIYSFNRSFNHSFMHSNFHSLYLTNFMSIRVGFNPLFDETFEFHISLPELALVRFLVQDDDFIGDAFIGQYTIPMECMLPGYRHIRLLSVNGEPLESATLFVHVTISSLNEAGVGAVLLS